MNEAELLFTQILNCSRQDLYLQRDRPLDKKNCELISRAFRRRLTGEPIQYILGNTEFIGLEFKVTPDVFIPRPETEILVETAIKTIKSQRYANIPPYLMGGYAARCGKSPSHQVTKLKILDIGTGSGCIAISLAKSLPDTEVTATDISSLALRVARENAKLNNVKVNFLKSNLFDLYDLRPMVFDLIVSNPPYIPTSEIQGLAPEVRYQPRMAFYGGSDGLNFYRRIIREAPANLRENGHLILEIGFNQRKAIEEITRVSGELSIVEISRDYNNIERVIVFKKSGSQHG